jgi:hypothetical protein
MKVRLKPLHHLVADHPKDHRIGLEPGITVLGRGEDTKYGVNAIEPRSNWPDNGVI